MTAISSKIPLPTSSYTDQSSSSSSTISTPKTLSRRRIAIIHANSHLLAIQNAKRAYLEFRELAKDYYIACTGYRRIEEGKIVQMRIGYEILTKEYHKTKLKQSKDFTPRDHDVINLKATYDRTLQAFEKFQRSARKDIREEVVKHAITQTTNLNILYTDILDSNISISSTLIQAKNSLQILEGQLIASTEKLKQQAAELFTQWVLFHESDSELQRNTVKTYNRFLIQTLAVEILLNTPPKLPTLSQTWQALKAAF